jgi:hypothetical protein
VVTSAARSPDLDERRSVRRNYVEGSTMLGENIALKLKYRPEISLRLPTFAAQNVTRKTYNVKRQE